MRNQNTNVAFFVYVPTFLPFFSPKKKIPHQGRDKKGEVEEWEKDEE